MEKAYMNKKYEITSEVLQNKNGQILHRIRALRDIGRDVKVGDLGGWISTESNLSQEGECWIYDTAVVCHNAIVEDNAQIRTSAAILHSARIFGNAVVRGFSGVSGHARIYGDAIVCDDAIVDGNARVYGESIIQDHASVFDNAIIRKRGVVRAWGKVCGDGIVEGGFVGGNECWDHGTWTSGGYF